MLTDSKVRSAKPLSKVYKLSDGRGLHLLVHPNGGKYWQLRYRFLGKEKTASLGTYPETSISQAREGREALRRQLRGGIDPVEARRADKRARQTRYEHTFKQVALGWFDVWKIDKDPQTVAYKLRRLEQDLIGHLGSRPVPSITRKEVIDIVKMIASRGVNETAHRALQVIKQIFAYSVTNEICPTNPVADLRPSEIIGTVPTKNYARIEPERLPELLRKIDAYEGFISRCAMRFMCLTFVRTGTLRSARWNEVDFEKMQWIVPAANMKKVKGTRAKHIVPLSKQAIQLLVELKSVTGDEGYLFPGDRRPQLSENTILLALDRMGFKGKMTGHGFRGLASTILHENGFDKAYIDRQMGHLDRTSVSSAYNYAEYLKQRAEMMQWWADYLGACVNESK
jgi:integrase